MRCSRHTRLVLTHDEEVGQVLGWFANRFKLQIPQCLAVSLGKTVAVPYSGVGIGVGIFRTLTQKTKRASSLWKLTR